MAFACLWSWQTVTAQTGQSDTTRIYTTERPLIYEDAWDLWPYVFLNENGEPDGYNIDLLKQIFKELDIPYVIKLKPTLMWPSFVYFTALVTKFVITCWIRSLSSTAVRVV